MRPKQSIFECPAFLTPSWLLAPSLILASFKTKPIPLQAPTQVMLTTELARGRDALTWWVEEGSDDSSAEGTKWGLRFGAREAYVAFKALATAACEANVRKLGAEVVTPHVLEVPVPAEAEPFQRPSSGYIQRPCAPAAAKGWLPGAAAPMYEADDEDHRAFLESEPELSELAYERLVDTFEVAEAEAAAAAAAAGGSQAALAGQVTVTAHQVLELLAQVPTFSPKLGGAPSTVAVEHAHAHW
eukprot:1196194-Prorocentrum_minimum.AAC.6